MGTQKARPIDAFQRIAASFKMFENKLDKLQEDVDYHGQTLSELRNMVTNLSGGAILAAVNKVEDNRSLANKSTAIQYEIKIKNKNPVPRIQSMPPKLKMKTYQGQKTKPKMTPQTSPFQVHGNKMELGPKSISQKHAQRHRRAEAQRKTINSMRTQKISEKKRIKV